MPEQQCDVYFYSPYEDKAGCPLLVFLPGLNETGQGLMSRQMASLKDYFNIRCLVIPPQDLNDWDVIAESTLALIEAETSAQKSSIYLCGESFGGCLALEMLRQAQDWFEKIILINPASSFRRVFWLNFGSHLLQLTPEWIYHHSAWLTPAFLTNIDRVSTQACEHLADTVRCTSKQAANRRIGMMRNFQVNEIQLGHVATPVLLIGSREDLILPSVQEAHRLANIFLEATVVTLPHSGHACLVEEEVDLYQIMAVNNFLESALSKHC